MLDKFERNVIITALTVSALFIFSIFYALGAKRQDVTECLPYNKTYETARVEQIDAKTYQIFYVARMWNFEPAVSYIPVGSEVDLFVTSLDVVHGFNVFDKNVNLMGVPGGVSRQRSVLRSRACTRSYATSFAARAIRIWKPKSLSTIPENNTLCRLAVPFAIYSSSNCSCRSYCSPLVFIMV